MGRVAVITVFFALLLPAWASEAAERAPLKSINEKEIRAVSSKRYSELLRLACLNGFRFRPGAIESGFHRHYEETKLAFIDEGYSILPDLAPPRLIVVPILMGGRMQGDAASEPNCFRARWSDK